MEYKIEMLSAESLALATDFAAIQWIQELGGTQKEFRNRIPKVNRVARIERAAGLIAALRGAGINVELKD